jgi:hypothetical protein
MRSSGSRDRGRAANTAVASALGWSAGKASNRRQPSRPVPVGWSAIRSLRRLSVQSGER